MLIDVVLHEFITQYDLISELQFVAPSLLTTFIVFPGPPEQGLSGAPKSCTKKQPWPAVSKGDIWDNEDAMECFFRFVGVKKIKK